MQGEPVPVVLVFFRRECTLQVFEQIRAYAPQRLYLIADGGRTPEEHAQCVELRKKVEAAIDWPCDVRTRYSDVNLGCRGNIPAGLDWVFSEVDRAIILEDDCVPALDFFRFCEEMLERYCLDSRIFVVSGSNYLDDQPFCADNSYLFSGYTITWGWATWARAWSKFDVDMRQWPEARRRGLLKSMFLTPPQEVHWDRVLESVWNRTCKCDPWDYQWTFATWLNGGLSIIPGVNLVTNVGVGELATHVTEASAQCSFHPTRELQFPLTHPARERNADYDVALGDIVYYGSQQSWKQLMKTRVVFRMPYSLRSWWWRLEDQYHNRLKTSGSVR